MFDIFYYNSKPNLFSFERSAISLTDASNQSRTKFFWYVDGDRDYSKFNFDYVPAPWQEHFIHVFPSQWQKNSGVFISSKYNSSACDYHYVENNMAMSVSSTENWFIPESVDIRSVDLTWHPDALDTPYIYHFPSQWQAHSGVTYTVPGATEIKVVSAFTVRDKSSMQNWFIPESVDIRSVDLTWHPDALDTPYIYHFPSVTQAHSGVTYTVPGATDIKVVSAFTVRDKSSTDHWCIPESVDVRSVDLTWHPDALDDPYIYHFPSATQVHSGVTYTVPGATEIKVVSAFTVIWQATAPGIQLWFIPESVDTNSIDLTWHPDALDDPYIYHFPSATQAHSGVTYTVPGATEIKVVSAFTVTHRAALTTDRHWFIPDYTDPRTVDLTWQPDALDTPYIYHFPSQWQAHSGVTYTVPGATDMKTIAPFVTTSLADMQPWGVPEDINADGIDFSWHPDVLDIPYIYHFPSQWQLSSGLTYTVPGATEIKLLDDFPTRTDIAPSVEVVRVLSIFFIDRNNATAGIRFERLKLQYPHAQKIRYVNSMMSTIQRCAARSESVKFWVISSEYDYDNFDFHWQPASWQSSMTHVFPSQWQKWSDTFLINKFEFASYASWATALEDFPNLNFVADQQVTKPENTHEIYYVDHGNPDSISQLSRLRLVAPDMISTRFVGEYLATFKRIIATASTEYVWIINSICDYTNFDFSWQPEPWQRKMIHVFASGAHREGDTFHIHVESFRAQMHDLELLDWFQVINYCTDQQVPQWPMPVVTYEGDNLVAVIKAHDFTFPYTMFTRCQMPVADHVIAPTHVTIDTDSDIRRITRDSGTGSLWSRKDRTVRRITQDGSTVLVPRDIKADLRSQLYDYAHIDNGKSGISRSEQCEIIFISYDEPQADSNYAKLVARYPAAKRSHGVQGMDNALRSAAALSSTPWFFAVFAKTELSENFDFSYTPDYFQEPKHYIFYAHNPMNGLEYGHMGVVMYNCNIIKNLDTFGIDYTLSAPHEVVPLVSALANFNVNEYQTWRTAFRECAKLSQYADESPSIENSYRLDTWTSVAHGEYAEWCLRGANDGVEFYHANKTNHSQLKNAFNWEWLIEYFELKYNNKEFTILS